MSRVVAVLSAAAWILVLPVQVWAQNPQPSQLTPAEAQKRVRDVIVQELVLPAASDPSGARVTIKPESSATIVAGASGFRGEFKYSIKASEGTYFNFKLSTPGTSDRAELLLGDDLPSGMKVEIGGARLFLPALDTIDLAAVRRTSVLTMLSESGQSDGERLHEAARALEEGCALKPEGCALKSVRALLFAGNVSYGRETFKFRASDLGADVDELRESTTMSVLAGMLTYQPGSASPIYIGGGVKVGRAWKAKTPKTQCTATGTAGLLDCSSVYIGEPDKLTKRSVSIEVRQKIGDHFGWVPQASYDFADSAKGKRFTVEVPLYLVTNGAATQPALNGGVAVGYREGRGVYAAVFVGPTFPLLPKRAKKQVEELNKLAPASAR